MPPLCEAAACFARRRLDWGRPHPQKYVLSWFLYIPHWDRMSNLASKCTKSNKFFGRESLVRQFSREIITSSPFPFSISKGLMERCSTVLWLQALNNCWYFQNWMLFDLELICCIDFYFSWLLFFQSIQHLVQCESSGYVCQKGQSSQLLVVLLLPWYSATSFPKRSLKPIIRPEKRSFTLKRHNYF